MVYNLRFFFSSKCSLFHNSNVFGPCIIHILYTGCAKIKKNNSAAKRLRICNAYCFSTTTMLTQTCLIVTFYVHYLDRIQSQYLHSTIYALYHYNCYKG